MFTIAIANPSYTVSLYERIFYQNALS